MAFSAVAAVVSTAISVYSQEQASSAAASGARYNAQISGLEGKIAQTNAISQQNALDYKAAEEKTAAGQENASAQQKEILDQRTTALAISRARALGAADGGDALDPSVVNIMGDLQAQGDYKTATDKYNGTQAANALIDQSNLDTFQGQLVRQKGDQQAAINNSAAVGFETAADNDVSMGNTKAFATVIDGAAKGATMYDKYSSNLPSSGDQYGQEYDVF